MEKNDSIQKQLIARYEKVAAAIVEKSDDLLKKHQEKGWALLGQKGIPTQKTEDYKYTDLSQIFEHPYQAVLQENAVQKGKALDLDAYQLYTHNGILYNDDFKALAEKGVIIASFSEALKQHAQLFASHYNSLAKESTHGVVGLNTALATEGVFIYIPPNLVLEKPIQLIGHLQAKTDSLITERKLIVVEENAQAEFILTNTADDSSASYLSNNVTELVVAPAAIVKLYTLQDNSPNVVLLNSLFVSQDQNSNVTTQTWSLNGGLIRNNIWTSLVGEHCENFTMGFYVENGEQHVDNYTAIDHRVPNCTSTELFKGILSEKASSAFCGKIHVFEDAQKTMAYQTNNNILLADTAVINTKPQLIIEADDVKCSHGATIGQMDEEAIHYLRARGIGQKEAYRMLLFAFVQEVFETVSNKLLIELINNPLGQKLKKMTNE